MQATHKDIITIDKVGDPTRVVRPAEGHNQHRRHGVAAGAEMFHRQTIYLMGGSYLWLVILCTDRQFSTPFPAAGPIGAAAVNLRSMKAVPTSTFCKRVLRIVMRWRWFCF